MAPFTAELQNSSQQTDTVVAEIPDHRFLQKAAQPIVPAPLSHARYERKFAIASLGLPEIRWLIRTNPALFRPIYAPRYISNVYFDTLDRKFFNDNVAGVASRLKVRIRWYHPEHHSSRTADQKWIEKPILELKIKEGLAGWKESYPLPPLSLDALFCRNSLQRIAEEASLPPRVVTLLNGLTPALTNRYLRAYFKSACEAFRVTLDNSLSYAALSGFSYAKQREVRDRGLHIIELKYTVANAAGAPRITNAFPFRLSRNSKYVRGMLLTHA